MSTRHDPEALVAGTMLADWNAEVAVDSDYLVRAVIDNNSEWGVAFDMNQQRPEGPPRQPEEPPEVPAPDPESAWIGERRSGEGTNLPHSWYASPDLTFVDPADREQGYEPYVELRRQLAAQAR